MPKIIFESNTGVIFEKTEYKNGRCKVDVKGKTRNNLLLTYRFKNLPEFQSPYLSWENLNCCGGWECDESYLYTAVQQGKKLFSAITFTMFDDDYVLKHAAHNLPSREDEKNKIEEIKRTLPDDCIMEIEDEDRRGYCSTFAYYFICKKGTIGDHMEIDDVLLAYKRLVLLVDNRITEA